ncbi:MAG: polysaccharide deacetylase family protein [Bacillus sp. (in: Bacteria)]|nr:polysaccharide deacetylase family protein [Bacillus sp. (in: firmicutes)]MCM1427190.1 polysaccharide deacetylase family protein [Eubacterium sp.]
MFVQKKRIFFFSVILIVSLLFYFLGRKHEKEPDMKITAQKIEEDNSITVEKVLEEREENETCKIALTFDDGPHPYYTEQLLDGLKERNVRATFFVTGEHAELYADIIKRMSEEGHLIGNHTYSHMQLQKGHIDDFKEELLRTNEVISGITGEEVLFVRPPYGTWEKSLESELNMFPVLWTIDPLDWCSSDADNIARKILIKAEENAIILMHDSYAPTVTAAFRVIDELQKEGYEFVTVDEILFD